MVNLTATLANFRKACFRNTRTALVGALTDVGTNVYSSYPIKNVSFPLIVIESAQKLDSFKSLKDRYSEPATVFVTIYAKQAEKMDVYADEIEADLWAYESTFKTYNLFLKDIVDNEGNQFEDVNDNKGHSKTLSVMFELK